MYEIETRSQDDQTVAVMHGSSVEPNTLGSWLSTTYGTLAMHLQRIGVAAVGMPFARYHRRVDGGSDVIAGLPVAEVVDHKDEVMPDTLPGGEVASVWHPGPRHEIAAAYEAIEAWLARTGSEPLGDPWEIYHTDPETDPDASSWLIEVVQPFRDA